MKKLLILIVALCMTLNMFGCQNKKAELQKKYNDTTYQIQQIQQQIDDLQKKMDLDEAARADADKSGATSDSEYGKILASQDDETYNKALEQITEYKKQLEAHKLYQETLKSQLDSTK